MRKKTGKIQWVLCTAMLGILSCAKLGEEKLWNNPFDPGGTNWHPPTVAAPGDTNVAFNDTIALGATGSDDNGSIVGYWWSFDHGITWPLSGTFDTPARRLWGAEGIGAQVLWVKAKDNDGIFSAPDSCVVIVHEYRPTVRQVADTVVSQAAAVSINLSASDTNGAISRYFWKTGIQGPWSDSTMTPQLVLSHPQGGGISIVWGAEDHDGLLRCDTFAILFNRGPVAVEMLSPRNNDTAQFIAFNFIEESGTTRLRFTGSDPDSGADTLTYTLFLGKEPSALVQVWTGRETEVVIPDLESASTYSWKLGAKDLFGDSIQNSGSFRTPRSPNGPAGMVLIRSAGKSFTMGLPGGESYETPLHPVAFSYHLWIDTVEVTCRDYGALIPGSFESSALPATGISWFDAVLYCNARSKREGKDTVYRYTGVSGTPGKGCILDGVQCAMKALGYRLPTEAEWEYACRAGSEKSWFWGDSRRELGDYAWYRDNAGATAHQVGARKPNPFGLYDICGNVWEWCNDWFGADYYQNSPAADPIGPESGTERVLRGGSWSNSDYFAQSGVRSRIMPGVSNTTIGFRVVLQHP